MEPAFRFGSGAPRLRRECAGSTGRVRTGARRLNHFGRHVHESLVGIILEAGGPYTADYYDLSAIGGGRFYKVTVTASATGGVPPYKYTWQGFSERASATTVYVFQTRADHIRKVTVKDAVNFPKWDKATIHAGTGAGGSSGATDFSLEVSIGGDLYLVWGEDTAITASSSDTSIVTVNVASAAVRVTGVGAGNAEVVLGTVGGELRLPVAVK